MAHAAERKFSKTAGITQISRTLSTAASRALVNVSVADAIGTPAARSPRNSTRKATKGMRSRRARPSRAPVRTGAGKETALSIAQADCNENDCRVDGARGNVQPRRRGRSPGDSEHERGGEEQAEHPTHRLSSPMLHESRARRARSVAFGVTADATKGLSSQGKTACRYARSLASGHCGLLQALAVRNASAALIPLIRERR